MNSASSNTVAGGPTQPVLTRDNKTANYAPEIMAMIEKGIIDEDKNVCRGFIEYTVNSTSYYMKAFTLEDMTFAHCRDTHRAVHSLELPKETVMDNFRMGELEQKMEPHTFEKLVEEWNLMIQWLMQLQ